jgi:hypothetical protein
MLSLLLLLSNCAPEADDSVRAHTSEERLRHFECFNVVRIIEHSLHSNKSATAITDELTSHCAKLTDPRKAICEALVPAHIGNVTAQLSANQRPDVICESLGFVRHFGGGRVVSEAQCIRYADLARAELKESDNADAQKAPGDRLPRPFSKLAGAFRSGGFRRFLGLSAACKGVPAEERAGCHGVASLVSRGLSEGIEKAATGEEICKKLNERHLIKLSDGEIPARINS